MRGDGYVSEDVRDGDGRRAAGVVASERSVAKRPSKKARAERRRCDGGRYTIPELFMSRGTLAASPAG